VLTGIGIAFTSLVLGKALSQEKPDRLLSIGIAGAYMGSGMHVGDVIVGDSEVFGDLGVETPVEKSPSQSGESGFISLSQMPFSSGKQPYPHLIEYPLAVEPWNGHWPVKKGCTVNLCTGTQAMGASRQRYWNADFETMEGAAIALAGHAWGVPVLEMRAISNIASDRDMHREGVQKALLALRDALVTWSILENQESQNHGI
jgi:futalosine hydrolase